MSPARNSLADLRTCQDWYLRYHLKSVPGVAEVAPVGGFGKQFQVNLDPNRLQAYGIPIRRVVEAVRSGNVESGGRLLEFGGTEYMVRGRGYIRSLQDIERPRARQPQRHAHPHPRRRRGGARPRPAAGRVPTWTARAKWFPASSSCAMARTRWR